MLLAAYSAARSRPLAMIAGELESGDNPAREKHCCSH
jgi:hypothetical protein